MRFGIIFSLLLTQLSFAESEKTVFQFPKKYRVKVSIEFHTPTFCERAFDSYDLGGKYYAWYDLVNRAYNLPMNQIDGSKVVEEKKIELYTAAIQLMGTSTNLVNGNYYYTIGDLVEQCVRLIYDGDDTPRKNSWLYYTGDHVPLFIAYINRSVSRVNRGYWDSALQDSQIAKRLAENHPYPNVITGRIKAALGKYDEMRAEFKIGLEKTFFVPEKLLYLNELGNSEYSARNYPASEEAFRTALTAENSAEMTDRFFSKVHNNLGLVLRSIGGLYTNPSLDASIEEFQKARKLDPMSPVVITNLARSLSMQGTKDSALSSLQAHRDASGLDPDDGNARLHKAMQIWIGIEKFQLSSPGLLNEAFEDARVAVTRYPQPGYAVLWRWIIRRASGQTAAVADSEIKAFTAKLDASKLGVSELITKVYDGSVTEAKAKQLIEGSSIVTAVVAERLSEMYFYLGMKEYYSGNTAKAKEYFGLSKQQNIPRSQEWAFANFLL